MIAKIGKGQHLYGALCYNQLKVDKENGQVLLLNKIPETINNIYTVAHFSRYFEPYLAVNNKTEKPVLHISLNPDPLDKLSDEDFKSIAMEYMEQMGYDEQPFVVFKHTDIERTHIHIVTTCVGIDGKKISDRYDRPRSMAVCRALEQKYQLTPVTDRKRQQDSKTFKPVDYNKGNVKSQLASVVRYLPKTYTFQTLGEYNALLSLFNIAAEKVEAQLNGVERKGLVYFVLNDKGEKTSNPFKSSLFGKQAGLTTLNESMLKTKEGAKNNPAKTALIKTIAAVLNTSNNEQDFKQRLIQKGINLVTRKNTDGRIYGITFIDHKSKSVWNGSSLSKQLSANVFNEWWNNNGAKPMLSSPNITNQENLFTDKSTVQNTATPISSNSNPIENWDKNGVGDLFSFLLPEVQGVDYEEEAFINQMQKKKKGKKRRQ
ncbi:relaxase [Chryseobacterium piperi]|uniref:Relaxase n=1 Tax=Chryseobacterium piperi TaxID=558152 RepID=A0A086A5M0_9FLAO|nr:conjugal transfer protein MobB [Chryseobacterium piperi]ASW76313.1 relaxase [Chryseobacterium piperi]KFF11984.1 relaxase [Chryseobacterium piperi]